MAHRFNSKTGRAEPKPSARERTWYRWRMRHGLETKQDVEHFNRWQQIKIEIEERLISKLRKKKAETQV